MEVTAFDTLTSADFFAVFDVVQDLVPKALMAVIGFIGLRKGLSFLTSMLRGA